MNLIKLSALAFLGLVLTACGPKLPECNSPEVAKLVTSYVAGQIIDDGADDERAPELIKRLTVTDIKTIPQPGRSVGMRCAANVAIAYPADFGGKIFNVFTNPKNVDALKDHLDIKYGAFYGPATYRQLAKLFTAGVNQVELRTLTPEQVDGIVNKTIQKNIDTLLTLNNKVDVNFDISNVEGAVDKNAFVVKSQINDIENYDQNVLLLKFLGNLQ